MLEAITEGVSNLMGLSLEAHDLHWYHVTARASVAYVLVLALVRLGHKRFLGKGSALMSFSEYCWVRSQAALSRVMRLFFPRWPRARCSLSCTRSLPVCPFAPAGSR